MLDNITPALGFEQIFTSKFLCFLSVERIPFFCTSNRLFYYENDSFIYYERSTISTVFSIEMFIHV